MLEADREPDRSPGAVEAGPSLVARCSTRLSTPPSDVARVKRRVLPDRRDRRLAPRRDVERDHRAEGAHLAAGRLVPRVRREAPGS